MMSSAANGMSSINSMFSNNYHHPNVPSGVGVNSSNLNVNSSGWPRNCDIQSFIDANLPSFATTPMANIYAANQAAMTSNLSNGSALKFEDELRNRKQKAQEMTGLPISSILDNAPKRFCGGNGIYDNYAANMSSMSSLMNSTYPEYYQVPIDMARYMPNLWPRYGLVAPPPPPKPPAAATIPRAMASVPSQANAADILKKAPSNNSNSNSSINSNSNSVSISVKEEKLEKKQVSVPKSIETGLSGPVTSMNEESGLNMLSELAKQLLA